MQKHGKRKTSLKKGAALCCALLLAATLAACSANNTNADTTAQNGTVRNSENAEAAETAASGTAEAAENTQDTTEAGNLDGALAPNVNTMSINEALQRLRAHYGSGYTVNGRTGDETNYSFHVLYNGTLYAKVVVNLKTGQATETKIDSGEQSEFVLE